MDPGEDRQEKGEEEEEDYKKWFFPIHNERSEEDMSAMVCALAQVIGASPNNSCTNTLSSSHQNSTNHESHATQVHQGTYVTTCSYFIIKDIYSFIYLGLSIQVYMNTRSIHHVFSVYHNSQH